MNLNCNTTNACWNGLFVYIISAFKNLGKLICMDT